MRRGSREGKTGGAKKKERRGTSIGSKGRIEIKTNDEGRKRVDVGMLKKGKLGHRVKRQAGGKPRRGRD